MDENLLKQNDVQGTTNGPVRIVPFQKVPIILVYIMRYY